MLIQSARFAVIVFGLLICGMCLWGFVKPVGLIGLVKTVARGPTGIYVAVGVRVVLGAALIAIAPFAMFPLLFRILGWVTLAAALGLLIVRRRGMLWVLGLFDGVSPTFIRMWLVFGLVFGALLVYGAV